MDRQPIQASNLLKGLLSTYRTGMEKNEITIQQIENSRMYDQLGTLWIAAKNWGQQVKPLNPQQAKKSTASIYRK